MEEAYNNLFLTCFKIQNAFVQEALAQKLMQQTHVILFTEEPNVVAKYFLEQQYDSPYTLEPRVINANIDGEYMDVDFFESRLTNGAMVGHLEFDMNSYTKTKVYYIMEKVIQPMIETLDIGKVMDTGTENKKKIIFLKNFDMVMRVTTDDKIINKVIHWLEKHACTTNFLFSFQMGFAQLSKQICHYALPLRTHRIVDSPAIEHVVGGWLKEHYPGAADAASRRRPIVSFGSFRYYMRHLIMPKYYESLHTLISSLFQAKATLTDVQKLVKIRAFVLDWLQDGKTHNELLKETRHVITTAPYWSEETKKQLVLQVAERAKYIEKSKKVIYHLENVLAIFAFF